MRYSKFFPKTIKEDPQGEESVNARYLLRGGFIDKLMAGSYTLLPLGFRVVNNINNIIREELNKTGAQELLMPLLHPKDVWNETGRWDSARDVMYQFAKNDREYALSFTHEEIVVDLIRKHVRSYKDLPVSVYHFSTKFRNELRAKSGILRGREFLMKDLYSAHTSFEDMDKYYWEIADAYMRIFDRIGLNVIITEADGGVFTDSNTHEFQVESSAGEDTIYINKAWKYAKNEEIITDEERNDSDTKFIKSIEVGNIFPLGTYYAEKMNAIFNTEKGESIPFHLASYGIGPTRVMGTVVEVSHDDRGIVWPDSIAPYKVNLIGLNLDDAGVRKKSDEVYERLLADNVDVLYDDREVAPGQKFADSDLIGIPMRLVVSSKTGDNVEFKRRDSEKIELINPEKIVSNIK